MSAYPLMLEGASLRALVVGGGSVATRKVRALLAARASVRLVAPATDPTLEDEACPELSIERRAYVSDDIGDAMLVIAATSSRDVNAQVGRDAQARGRLVNIVDAPEESNCSSPATHRVGDVVIAVSAGGVPAIAARIRDCIAARYTEPYAAAVAELGALRSRFLESGNREAWARVVDIVIDEDFCEAVERGALADRMAPWR